MALIQSTLTSSLVKQWLSPPGGRSAESAQQSGSRFARAVATWFSAAQAAGAPCVSALAREAELATNAASALRAGTRSMAGQLLGTAVVAYLAGQTFGSGIALVPLASSFGISMFMSGFSLEPMDDTSKAKSFATGCFVMSLSTIVVFSTPPYVATVI